MTLGEVATQLKLPKSSALTLLRALVVTEFCVADEKGFYALGLHSFEVGAAYLRSMTPVRSVTPGAPVAHRVAGRHLPFRRARTRRGHLPGQARPPRSGPEAGQFARRPTAGGGNGGRQGTARLPRSTAPGVGRPMPWTVPAQHGQSTASSPVGARARTGEGAQARLRRRRRPDRRRDPVRGCSVVQRPWLLRCHRGELSPGRRTGRDHRGQSRGGGGGAGFGPSRCRGAPER